MVNHLEKGGKQMKTRLLIVALAASLASAILMLLLVCSAVPLMAQQTAPPSGTGGTQPAATSVTYPIGCLSATGCKKGYVPVFGSTGGSATVSDSIVSQNGSTITIAGSATATDDVNVGGQVKANSVTTTASTGGVNSTMTGGGNSIAAITGSATATGAAGFTFGVIGQSASDTGRGVFGLSTGNGGVGVIGENNNGPGIGVVGKALPGSTGYGVYGSGPVGVYGTGSDYGFQTDSNVQQARTAGGWAKAMITVNGLANPPTILGCFNSTLSGSSATTPPCGFTLSRGDTAQIAIDVGFKVDDRFPSVVAQGYGSTGNTGIIANAFGIGTFLWVYTFSSGGSPQNTVFYVVIF
jgi:hypothetical protein